MDEECIKHEWKTYYGLNPNTKWINCCKCGINQEDYLWKPTTFDSSESSLQLSDLENFIDDDVMFF